MHLVSRRCHIILRLDGNVLLVSEAVFFIQFAQEQAIRRPADLSVLLMAPPIHVCLIKCSRRTEIDYA